MTDFLFFTDPIVRRELEITLCERADPLHFTPLSTFPPVRQTDETTIETIASV
jgi:hypothetical protein